MKKLTQTQMLDLVLNDLESWLEQGDSDCGMAYAFRNGYRLHAANCWMGTGAMSESIEAKVEGLRISRSAEMKEIGELCAEAHIYICPDCDHHAFLDEDEGESIDCSSCRKTALKDSKQTA